jgi:hypothetical protein
MATLCRHIEVEAPPSVTESTWSHFVTSVRNGRLHLACDELVCVDAVKTGMVTFSPIEQAGTMVEFTFEMDGNGETMPDPDVVGQNMARDLVVFKDYVERGGEYGRPTANELREMNGREERSRHEAHRDHISRGYEDASNKADMYPA